MENLNTSAGFFTYTIEVFDRWHVIYTFTILPVTVEGPPLSNASTRLLIVSCDSGDVRSLSISSALILTESGSCMAYVDLNAFVYLVSIILPSLDHTLHSSKLHPGTAILVISSLVEKTLQQAELSPTRISAVFPRVGKTDIICTLTVPLSCVPWEAIRVSNDIICND